MEFLIFLLIISSGMSALKMIYTGDIIYLVPTAWFSAYAFVLWHSDRRRY